MFPGEQENTNSTVMLVNTALWFPRSHLIGMALLVFVVPFLLLVFALIVMDVPLTLALSKFWDRWSEKSGVSFEQIFVVCAFSLFALLPYWSTKRERLIVSDKGI